jgi:hypothetical protein
VNDFTRAVLHERARLAIVDPIGELDALVRLDQATAMEIVEATKPMTVVARSESGDRRDDALIAALGIPPGESHGLMRCPAHDDRRPSLKWTVKPNGKLLVHCHAGCSLGEIWRATR